MDPATPQATRAGDPLDDALDDFVHRQFAFEGITHRVHVSGQGPAVIVMPEMPGISPDVARFARWVRQAGFRVLMPSLFGRDGALPGTAEGIEVFRRTCIRAEFQALAGGGARLITQWLCALAREAHAECGGPGVGVVGMCFTGNFALTMVLEPAVIAPVLAQPSLPLDAPGRVDMGDAALADVAARLERDDLTVLAYRFAGDAFCRAERFAAYEEALGDRFVGRVLPDSAANPEAAMKNPHSVVTAHLIDREGEPTRQALDEILGFFRMRLGS
jgi:dienelactone hydrolase